MHAIKPTQAMTKHERAIARFAYTNALRAYIKFAHQQNIQNHFAEFTADVCIKFCECLGIHHVNDRSIEFSRVAFNYAHIHYAALQPFSQTAQNVLGEDFVKYKQTVAEIEKQVASCKLNVANKYYTAY